MTTPLGPTGALKIAYELIDAQARHIEKLEAGKWGHDTRAEVQAKWEELEQTRDTPAADAQDAAVRDALHRQEHGPTDPSNPVHPTPCDRRQVEVTQWGDKEPTFIDGPCQHEDTGVGRSPATYAGGEIPPNPAASLIEAQARWEAAARTAPPHNYDVDHQGAAWAPPGLCERCDILAPLHGAVMTARTVLQWANQEQQPERSHRLCNVPGWEYRTTEGQRKNWNDADTPPPGEGWERNTDIAGGWERFDYTEESYWRRRKP
jgi:hypothetical protein